MAFLAAAFVALGACSDSGTGPEEDNGPPTFTVNAVSDTIFVSLGEAPRTVSVSDRSASTAWDLAISTTVILANGGVDGPGGVTVHCICQNVGATGTQIAAMTPQSELAAFTAVTAAQIPPDGNAWSPTAIVDNPWYWYDIDIHFIYPTFNVYLLKRGSAVYKLQFVNYYGPAGQSRQVQFRYERLVG
jgi:hypothetical protein